MIDILSDIQTRIKSKKSQYNNFGRYNYRSVEDILEAVKPYLKEHQCVITLEDEIQLIGDRFYIKSTAKISNKSEWISSSAYAREDADKKGMDLAQLTGATSSYARKYALAGLLALDDTEDFDSHSKSAEEIKSDDKARSEKRKEASKKSVKKVNYVVEFKKIVHNYDTETIQNFLVGNGKISFEADWQINLSEHVAQKMVENKEALLSALEEYVK